MLKLNPGELMRTHKTHALTPVAISHKVKLWYHLSDTVRKNNVFDWRLISSSSVTFKDSHFQDLGLEGGNVGILRFDDIWTKWEVENINQWRRKVSDDEKGNHQSNRPGTKEFHWMKIWLNERSARNRRVPLNEYLAEWRARIKDQMCGCEWVVRWISDDTFGSEDPTFP